MAEAFDDQTDEDFFDKLVGDDDNGAEFGAQGADSAAMARAFSDLSIGDGDRESTDVPEKEGASDSPDPVTGEEKKDEAGSPRGAKGTTGVKVVQWSSFNVGLEKFGSDTDFPTETFGGSPADETNAQFYGSANEQIGDGNGSQYWENSVAEAQQEEAQFYGSANEQTADVNGSQYWENSVASSQQQDAHFYGSANEQTTTDVHGSQYWENSVDSSQQQGAHFYGSASEQTTDVNGSQYWENSVDSSQHQAANFYGSASEQVTDVDGSQSWENLYPGWKYDQSTGQWYQTDTIDSSETKVEGARNGLVLEQRSEVSYLQQTANSVVETVANNCKTSTVSNWNQVAEVSNGYPPNMVFDPQYPEWYYDADTQQWYTLESYNQSVKTAADAVQEQPSQVNGSNGFHSGENYDMQNGGSHYGNIATQSFSGNHDTSYPQQNMWRPNNDVKNITGFSGDQQMGNIHNSAAHAVNYREQQIGFKAFEPVPGTVYHKNEDANGFQSFVPAESQHQWSQPRVEQNPQAHSSHSYYANPVNYSQQQFQNTNASNLRFSYANEGRSSAGRPPHALVTFGFGGKLIIMKDGSSPSINLDYCSQNTAHGKISILSLAEVVIEKAKSLSSTNGCDGYFQALCQESFPGPLVGGNASAKDVNKWIDEKITCCESSVMDARKGESLRLLLSLLKVSCQHYGKIRSPFNSDPSFEETEGSESAIAKLFASSADRRDYDSAHCMHSLPAEGQIQMTAIEMQNLLVAGKRKEALHCAQVGQLWGPALVLAAQLGEKYYIDTVKQMAQHQFISGSPLRTLCLLIAGQPADVFSVHDSINSKVNVPSSDGANAPQKITETMVSVLDDWKQNLAIITANRTKDDELVLIHLGDCLWKERGEISAAHTCYLVAEANFDSYSDSARLCLIGADHLKYPRTYWSPEAIQRTEIYEYSKVLGNSQFVLLQFQPYKLLYAYMLAEAGKVSDSLRYCQASLKLLKGSSRIPEVEVWKLLFSSLEERLRTHQHGGYSTDLAPTKLVGKLFTSIDRSIHRMMGSPPLPQPAVPQSSTDSNQSYIAAPKIASSQSTMAMSSLVPSASIGGISDWERDGTRKNIHTRSASEPDFGKSSRQDPSKDGSSADAQSKVSPSRFSRIGSQLFQKTVGWVARSRSECQAKLGESNKFYYDEKHKRWVEEGAEPPAEEVALLPPPTSSYLQSGMPDCYINNNALKSPSLAANGPSEANSPILQEQKSGMPPISQSPNQFSARARTGVRSRYVDTFNKGGGGTQPNKFHSSSAPSVKPLVGAKLFVPASPAFPNEVVMKHGSIYEATTNGDTSISSFCGASLSSPPLPQSSAMQQFPSMNGISPYGNKETAATLENDNMSLSSLSRAGSWSGSNDEPFNLIKTETLEDKPAYFLPAHPSALQQSNNPLQSNGGNFREDLHEVEL